MKYTENFIPSGYQVHVESYENDGDNNQLHVKSGLSEVDMKFYVDLAELFQGKHGNGFTKRDVFLGLIANVVENHPGISDETREKFTPNTEYDDDESSCNIRDEVEELTGQPGDGYYDSGSIFVRRATSIKVYYLPTSMFEVDIKSL
jgi:hypothetical protein